MAQTTNDIANGSILNIDGRLWRVVKFQHVKPGKGPAFVRTTIKDVLTGKQVERTFNAGVKIDFATLDNRNLQYSYKDGSNLMFMDTSSYDQVAIPEELLGDQIKYLVEGTDCMVSFFEGNPIAVQLPASVVLEVTRTEPGLQGTGAAPATSPPLWKPAPKYRSPSS